MKRLLLSITVFILSIAAFGQSTTNLNFSIEEYQKALWMTTRFYGAQRSGYGPNWLTANHEPTNVPADWTDYASGAIKGVSYIKDADTDGYDLTGGWFDCADYVKFGQTEFYSAYMLLLGYSEFPKGYHDYYSADYKGYLGADDYTWEGKAGIPNGIPDILDEVKYATDYLMKCVRSADTFYYQVGEGGLDHKVWCTSVFKSALPKAQGGELEGSRTVYKITSKGTSMVSLCGAALAAMSRLYRQYDAAYADACLNKAKQAYLFVMTKEKGNIGAPGGFYGSKSKYAPDCCIFCVEMFRATGDSSYIEKIYDEEEEFTDFMTGAKTWNHGYTLCYNNTEDIAYYMLGAYAGDTLAQSRLKSYVYDLYMPKSGYILNVKNNQWGTLRFPANQAFVYGLYNKMIGNLSEVDPYSLATIEYIMGNNTSNYSFITGFGENSPKYPHYRNIYLDDSNEMDFCEMDEEHSQLGYLVGGTFSPASYPDDINNYQSGEGGIDYNAGLVGALGYINSIIAPDSSASVEKIENTIACTLSPNPVDDVLILKTDKSGSVKLIIYNGKGQQVLMSASSWDELSNGINVSGLPSGSYLLKAVSAEGVATSKFIKR